VIFPPPEADQLAALRKAFFAAGHDARLWLDGWYPATVRMQHGAAQTVTPSDYWACGDVPLLELIGAYDPWKPKPYRDELRGLCRVDVSVGIFPIGSGT
jgi:hypothetical protein